MRTKESWMDWARGLAQQEAVKRSSSTGHLSDTTFREKEILAAKCVDLLEQLDTFHQIRNELARVRKQVREFVDTMTDEAWFSIGDESTCPECGCKRIRCICD